MTPRDFAIALLAALGAPVSSNNVAAVIAAEAIEGGHYHNGALFNPLNTIQRMPGSMSATSVGAQAYTSWAQGLDATVRTLTNGMYGGVLQSLRADAPPDVTLRAMQLSPWGWYTVASDGTKVPNKIGSAASYQAYGSTRDPTAGILLSPWWVLAGGAALVAAAWAAGRFLKVGG